MKTGIQNEQGKKCDWYYWHTGIHEKLKLTLGNNNFKDDETNTEKMKFYVIEKGFEKVDTEPGARRTLWIKITHKECKDMGMCRTKMKQST